MPPPEHRRLSLRSLLRRWETDGRTNGSNSDGRRLRRGGVVNFATGMGTHLDKSMASFFTPSLIYNAEPLEILAVESWAARNFVDIPIDDQFVEWRTWVDDDPEVCITMADAEERHRVTQKLAKAMKAARQYGSGLLCILTTEDDITEPLDIRRVRPGDLGNLLVANRFEASVAARDRDPFSPRFAQPQSYSVFPKIGRNFLIHSSRVVRFDGIMPNTDSGFSVYDTDWGVPSLVPVLLALTEDQTVVSAIAHLSQEASISVLKISDLRAAISGTLHSDDLDAPDLEQIGMMFNQNKSNYRVAMLDKEEEDYERVAVNFAGLPELLDRFDKRVAAAAKIPMTRWMGVSPAGLNATGDSDMMNYVISLESEREKVLTPVLAVLDEVLARDAGLRAAPEYEWGSLLQVSEIEKVQISKDRVQAVTTGLSAFMWDEDEGREMLNGDPLFGALDGPSPAGDDPFDDPADTLIDEPAADPGGDLNFGE